MGPSESVLAWHQERCLAVGQGRAGLIALLENARARFAIRPVGGRYPCDIDRAVSHLSSGGGRR